MNGIPIGTLLGVAALILSLAILLPFVAGARRKATLELLRTELAVEREARLAQDTRYKEQEARCNQQIAELRGQLRVVNDSFAKVIAREVVQVMRDEGVIP